jgi:hypothetical protein
MQVQSNWWNDSHIGVNKMANETRRLIYIHGAGGVLRGSFAAQNYSPSQTDVISCFGPAWRRHIKRSPHRWWRAHRPWNEAAIHRPLFDAPMNERPILLLQPAALPSKSSVCGCLIGQDRLSLIHSPFWLPTPTPTSNEVVRHNWIN